MSNDVENFLIHFGVLGMKWGHRKAASTGPSKVSVASPDAVLAKAAGTKIKEKGLESLSNEELQLYVSRLNLEQQYSKLSSVPKQKSAGQKFVGDLIANTAKNTLQQTLSTYAKKGIESGISAAMGFATKK